MTGILSRIWKRGRRRSIRCSAVVAAAGVSSRMGGTDKILAPLGGVPVLVRALYPLEESPLISEIIVVTREDLILEVAALCREHDLKKVKKVIVGGSTRLHSVYAGVCETAKNSELIAVHDGARPFLSVRVLEDAVIRAEQCGAAAPAIPVKDTVKRARMGMTVETPDRSELFLIQTPQVFESSLIRAALIKALKDKAVLTDDCSAVERMGMPVALTEGDEGNFKITTPYDLELGEALLEGMSCI